MHKILFLLSLLVNIAFTTLLKARTKIAPISTVPWVTLTLFPQPLPTSFDWRARGLVNAAQDANPCRADHIFAAAGALEAMLYIARGKKVKISEQQLRDCSQDHEDPCSANGEVNLLQVLGYAKVHPLALYKDYPYKQDTSPRKCPSVKGITDFNGFIVFQADGDKDIMNAVVQQPVIAFMDAKELSKPPYLHWDGLNPPVYVPSQCTTRVNHAILIVGFGTDIKYGPYWLVRNDWGHSWGDKGYFKIRRGTCGIHRAFIPRLPGMKPLSNLI